MIRKFFVAKLIILSSCMMFIGFIVGYAYTVVIDTAPEAPFYEEEKDTPNDSFYSVPTPDAMENAKDEALN